MLHGNVPNVLRWITVWGNRQFQIFKDCLAITKKFIEDDLFVWKSAPENQSLPTTNWISTPLVMGLTLPL